jgi:hypothetical protein
MHGLIQIIAMNEEAQRNHEQGRREQAPTMLLKGVDYGSQQLRRDYNRSLLISTRTSREVTS